MPNCRCLKKLTCKGTLRQVIHLSEAPSTHMTTYSPPPPPTHCIRVVKSKVPDWLDKVDYGIGLPKVNVLESTTK
jgi:hypothetical protein